jgi:hypothetical protein
MPVLLSKRRQMRTADYKANKDEKHVLNVTNVTKLSEYKKGVYFDGKLSIII